MVSKKKAKASRSDECDCGCHHQVADEGRIEAPKIMAVGAEGKVIHLSDGDFESVKGASEFLVVDFWAAWCGPCMMFGPILEKFAKAHAGEVTVAKMNVDENSAVPAMFNIESIPSIMFFRKGEPLGVVVGAVPLQKLEEVFKDLKKRSA